MSYAEVPARRKVNITATLKNLNVRDTVRFPAFINYGSIRPLAGVVGIRVRLHRLADGSIEVTRLEDKEKRAVQVPEEKLYDL